MPGPRRRSQRLRAEESQKKVTLSKGKPVKRYGKTRKRVTKDERTSKGGRLQGLGRDQEGSFKKKDGTERGEQTKKGHRATPRGGGGKKQLSNNHQKKNFTLKKNPKGL